MLVNIGPQHPATHGVLRLVCELDGETVVKCTPHIGYLHSSFEKLGEYRTWNQIVPLTDRMDYLAPLIYNCAYVMSVEAMMGIEVTERCKLTRVIMMEMDRIFGHLLWLGTFAMDVGAFTPFLYTFEEREKIYTLHEALYRRPHHDLGHPGRRDDVRHAGRVGPGRTGLLQRLPRDAGRV